MNDYKILMGVSVEDLQTQVQGLLVDGWQALGGVVIVDGRKPGRSMGAQLFYQTMIKSVA